MKVLLFGLIIGVLTLCGCSESSKEITKEMYGDDWPFTVTSGRLECLPPTAVVFHTNGKTYPLNGWAKTMGMKRDWERGDDIFTKKVGRGLMIEEGLKLCK